MKKILYSLVCFTLLLVSCSTIENRDQLGSLLNKEQLNFDITQTTAGSNTIKLKNTSSSKEFLPYWDWGFGFSNKDTATLYTPFKGDYTVKFTAMCAGGPVTIEKKFSVANNDLNYFSDPAWKLLAGEDFQGTTWVFAPDAPGFSGRIWGNGGYKGDFGPSWWGRTTADAADDNIDISSEMTFDLKGAKNFSITENGATKKGFFELKVSAENKLYTDNNVLWSYGKVIFSGATIPHGISQNENKKVVYDFDIVKITKDELVLCHQTSTATWEGWYWRFKRKGYTY